VRDNSIEIKTNVNDTLSLDYTANGVKQTFSFKLDGGVYKGSALADEIQSKLGDELKKVGLPEDLIEVSIGGVSTGAYGSNDSAALVFKQSNKYVLDPGIYIIDGISGSAAFSIFYQTDGDITVAYNKGAKTLEEETLIETGKNDGLSFEYDGVGYSITIPGGTYTPEDLASVINTKIGQVCPNVHAEIDDGKLKLYVGEYGKHTIKNVDGSAKNTVYYEIKKAENSDSETETNIQLSSIENNAISIERKNVSTVSLGINSLRLQPQREPIRQSVVCRKPSQI